MSDEERIWEDLSIAEHREAALEWAEETFPQFLENEALVAQLYLTNVLDKRIPPPVDLTSVADLLEKFKKFEPVIKPDGKESKLYATIEVMMVQMLDDSRGYFGCPVCYKKVDRTLGFCVDPSHPGEEAKGVSHTFQKWQSGDKTGNIIVTFGPSSHQAEADTKNYTLTIQGSVNNRDGSFNVWEIINKKAPKRLRKLASLKKVAESDAPEVEEELEVIEDEKTEDAISTESEESIAAIFGEEETEAEAEGLTEKEKNTVIKTFKKLLKQHYTKKPNSTNNLVNWISVQPQFKKWPKGSDERNAAVKKFIDEAENSGMFAYQDDKKETILSKLED